MSNLSTLASLAARVRALERSLETRTGTPETPADALRLAAELLARAEAEELPAGERRTALARARALLMAQAETST